MKRIHKVGPLISTRLLNLLVVELFLAGETLETIDRYFAQVAMREEKKAPLKQKFIFF